MTWNRTDAVAGVVAALKQVMGETVTVFDKPPQTANPPAVVVGRPTQVLYSTSALGIDEATLPVICAAQADGEDQVDALITSVRGCLVDPSLGGAVQSATATAERNWRLVTVAGIDLLQAEVELTIRM